MATGRTPVETPHPALNGHVTHGDTLLKRAVKEVAEERRGLILVSCSGRF